MGKASLVEGACPQLQGEPALVKGVSPHLAGERALVEGAGPHIAGERALVEGDLALGEGRRARDPCVDAPGPKIPRRLLPRPGGSYQLAAIAWSLPQGVGKR